MRLTETPLTVTESSDTSSVLIMTDRKQNLTIGHPVPQNDLFLQLWCELIRHQDNTVIRVPIDSSQRVTHENRFCRFWLVAEQRVILGVVERYASNHRITTSKKLSIICWTICQRKSLCSFMFLSQSRLVRR